MVCDLNLISDPLFRHTWSCLDHYSFKEALFTAERIFAENPTDESTYLLATCFYRCHGPRATRLFLLRQEIISPKCRYLLAKCNFEMGSYMEAENVIIGVSQLIEGPSEIATFYKDSAPFVLKLLADIYKQSDRRKLSINCLRKCLEINPLLWGAYTELVDVRDNVDSSEVFSLPKNVVLNNQTCLRALSNKINMGEIVHHNCPSKKRGDVHDSQEDLSVSLENVNPKYEEKIYDIVDSDIVHVSDEQLSYSFNGSGHHLHSDSATEYLHPNSLSELSINESSIFSQKKINTKNWSKYCEIEHLSPLFGNAYSEASYNTPEFLSIFNNKETEISNTKCNTSLKNHVLGDNPRKFKHNAKRVSFSGLKSTEISTPYSSKLEKINCANVSSLFNNNHMSKFDTLNYSVIPTSPLISDQGKATNVSLIEQSFDHQAISYTSTDIQCPRTRLQFAKAAAAQHLNTKKECSNSTEDFCGHKNIETDTRLYSTLHYLQLLTSMGRAYKFFKNYKLHDTITQIKQLPRHHSETALVSFWLATCYLESNEKVKACVVLSASMQNEPWQLHCIVLFSSILWMLNKENDLLLLSNDVTKMDRSNVEVWCVLGNLMSLNKENEVALRFFQRAIQLNPNYYYAYILIGHEYVAQDNLDKALTAFRRALDIDSYNYQANFCISFVYQRQENYSESEKILKETLKIFPDSLLLLTSLAVARSKLQPNFSSENILELLEKACKIYPKEAFSRFLRANILYKSGRYSEALNDLKMIEFTKEARIFFLMSLIYKQMGEMNKAMVYNSWAIELDPKCNNDSFILDRSFTGGTNMNDSEMGNNSTMPNINSSFFAGSRNSESMQEDMVSNNEISYDIIDTD